jgi:hypothetical protein
LRQGKRARGPPQELEISTRQGEEFLVNNWPWTQWDSVDLVFYALENLEEKMAVLVK